MCCGPRLTPTSTGQPNVDRTAFGYVAERVLQHALDVVDLGQHVGVLPFTKDAENTLAQYLQHSGWILDDDQRVEEACLKVWRRWCL